MVTKSFERIKYQDKYKDVLVAEYKGHTFRRFIWKDLPSTVSKHVSEAEMLEFLGYEIVLMNL